MTSRPQLRPPNQQRLPARRQRAKPRIKTTRNQVLYQKRQTMHPTTLRRRTPTTKIRAYKTMLITAPTSKNRDQIIHRLGRKLSLIFLRRGRTPMSAHLAHRHPTARQRRGAAVKNCDTGFIPFRGGARRIETGRQTRQHACTHWGVDGAAHRERQGHPADLTTGARAPRTAG